MEKNKMLVKDFIALANQINDKNVHVAFKAGYTTLAAIYLQHALNKKRAQGK